MIIFIKINNKTIFSKSGQTDFLPFLGEPPPGKGWKPQVFSLNGPIILDNGSFDLIFGPELVLTPRIALTVLGRDSPKLSWPNVAHPVHTPPSPRVRFPAKIRKKKKFFPLID